MRLTHLLRLFYFSACALAVSYAWSADDSATASAAQTVRAFYTYHLAHDKSFNSKTVDARSRWLAPDLVAACRTYFAQPVSPDEVPDIEGDPFTDTQEYPQRFRVENAQVTGDTARAQLVFLGRGIAPRKLEVALIRVKGTWLINDIVYDAGPTLRDLLVPPKR
jgi:hypothetical protein